MRQLSRLLLGAALVVGALAANVSPSRAAEPDKLLPAEADTVLFVNIKQVLDTAIVKKYALEQLKQALDGQDAKKLLTDLGLDPLKDIDRIIVGANIKNFNDFKFLMVVHGTFDPDRLYTAAEKRSKVDPDSFAMIKDGDRVIFKFTPENGEKPVYGTVVSEKTVIAATDRKMIADALKAAEAGKKALIKTELADLVKRMDEKCSVYACGIVKGKFDDLKLPAGGNIPVNLEAIQKLIPLTESMAVSVKVGADVAVEVTLGMKDTDTADEMRNALDDLIKQVKPLAALAGAAEPRAKPLADILNTVKTSSKDKDVTVSGKVTSANIGKLMKPEPDGE